MKQSLLLGSSFLLRMTWLGTNHFYPSLRLDNFEFELPLYGTKEGQSTKPIDTIERPPISVCKPIISTLSTLALTRLHFHSSSGSIDFSDLFISFSVDWTVKLWRAKAPAPPCPTTPPPNSGTKDREIQSLEHTGVQSW